MKWQWSCHMACQDITWVMEGCSTQQLVKIAQLSAAATSKRARFQPPQVFVLASHLCLSGTHRLVCVVCCCAVDEGVDLILQLQPSSHEALLRLQGTSTTAAAQ
jgi:hypothetical protein